MFCIWLFLCFQCYSNVSFCFIKRKRKKLLLIAFVLKFYIIFDIICWCGVRRRLWLLLRFQFNAEINKRAYHKIPTTNLLQELHLLQSLFISGEIDLVRIFYILYYIICWCGVRRRLWLLLSFQFNAEINKKSHSNKFRVSAT